MKPFKHVRKRTKKLFSKFNKIGLSFLMMLSGMSSSLMMVSSIQNANALTLYKEADLSISKTSEVFDLTSCGINKDGRMYFMKMDGDVAFCLDAGEHSASETYALTDTITSKALAYVYRYLENAESLGQNWEGLYPYCQSLIWAEQNNISDAEGKALLIETCGYNDIMAEKLWNDYKMSLDSTIAKTYNVYTNGRSGYQRIATTASGSRPTYDVKILNDSATAKYTMKNQVSVTKNDVESGQNLAGAVFDFYQNGKKVGSTTTNSNGVASFETSHVVSASATSGNYSYVDTDAESKPNLNRIPDGDTKAEAQAKAKADAEKKAKAAAEAKAKETTQSFYAIETTSRDKYWLNPNNIQTKTVTKTGTGAVNLGTITNLRQKGSITLTKTDDETDNPLDGAVFKFYAKNPIIHPDGKTGTLYNANEEVATFPATDENGETTLSGLYHGDYYIKEVTAPNLYVLDDSAKNISLTDKGQDVEISVSTLKISNKHQSGSVTITKHDQETDKTVPNAEYALYAAAPIYHPDGSGRLLYNTDAKVATFPRTNTNGQATVNNLYLGRYYIKEVNAPNGYLLSDERWDINIQYAGQNIAVSTVSQKVTDEVVRGNIFFEKFDKNLYQNTDDKNVVDGNKDGAQGDATRRGALYGIYAANDIVHKDTKTGVITYNQTPGSIHEIKLSKGTDLSVKNTPATAGALLATARTDANGQIQFDHLYLGDYYIKEIEPSEGYLLDTTRYDVSIRYAGQTVPIISTKTDVLEQVKKQGFEIFKLGHQAGHSGVGKPLGGVEFTVKLESDVQAMGWDEAPTYDVIVTDSRGHAVTKDLPYGYYRIKETKPALDYNTAEDFFVRISEDSRVPQDTIEANSNIIDEVYTSLLKVAKLDAETGKQIILDGMEFKIKALTDVYVGDTAFKPGEYVGYWDRSLFPKYVDSWTTNDEGYIFLQEKLGAGRYQLEEVHAPEPYVLGIVQSDGSVVNAPVEFVISNTGEHDKFEDTNNDVTFVTKSDTSVKGQIQVQKKGEVLTGFEDGNFTYEVKPLKDAVYSIYANENIMDPSNDGTVLYEKDEFVENITTGADGWATSSKLPLGSYYVKESKAPEGFVLNEEVKNVYLTYSDENTPIVFDAVTYVNDRQKVDLDMMKYDYDNEKVLPNAEFTIYANKDIKAYDGTVLFKTGEAIATVTSDKDGFIDFKLDLPVFEANTNVKDDFDEGFNIVVKDGYRYVGNFEAAYFAIHETKQPDGYITPNTIYAVDTSYIGQDEDTIHIEYDAYNDITKIDVEKTDLTNGHDVIGAHLRWIEKDTGKVIDEWVTNGKPHRIEGCVVGKTYILEETLPAIGYVTAESIEYTVKDTADVQKVEMKDDHTRVDISKLDKDLKDVFVEGTQLAVIPVKDDGTLDLGATFKTWVTKDGPERLEYISIGNYVLRETLQGQAWDYGYVTADDVYFTVKDTPEVQNVEMYDDHTKVEFSKVDKEDNNIYVAGAELSIIPVKEDGTLDLGATFDTWITQNDDPDTKENEALHFIERIPVGTYVLREKNRAEVEELGYVTAEDLIFEVADTGAVQKIVLEEDFTHIAIQKSDVKGKAIPNVTMSIVPVDEGNNLLYGETFETWLTVEDDPETKDIDESIHTINRIPIGKYAIVEAVAPEGYVKAEPIIVEVKDTPELQTYEMIDKQVSMSKVDVTGENEVIGAKMTVKDEDGNIIDQWISTDKPHNISGLEEGKTYTLEETQAPNGYVLAEAITFEVTKDKVNQHIQMMDKRVEISKVDLVEGTQIPGAHLIITDKETGEIVDETITTEKTWYPSGLIEGKTYILTEKSAPTGFEYAEDIEFTVTKEKVDQKVVMKDAPILTDLQINKVDSKTKKLITNSPAQFNLYSDEECTELIGSGNTINGLLTFQDLCYGTYYLKEVKAPENYKLDDTPIKIVLDDNTEGIGDIHTITVENVYKIIRTDDTANIAGMSAMAMMGLAGMYVFSRKKKEEE